MRFHKYQGTGNDFVLVDHRFKRFFKQGDESKIAAICDRHFGIGADGLILLEKTIGYDFRMAYFNSDGGESSMCGNGGRCLVAFAKSMGAFEGDTCRFLAIDGPHEAKILLTDDPKSAWVELKMADVSSLENMPNGDVFLNTGSPHVVRMCAEVAQQDLIAQGREVRYGSRFGPVGGTNVNLMEVISDDSIRVRTYERGVEDETLSCGTGVTAAALSHVSLLMTAGSKPNLPSQQHVIQVATKGGDLSVRFSGNPQVGFSDIWLCGPAQKVFEGKWK